MAQENLPQNYKEWKKFFKEYKFSQREKLEYLLLAGYELLEKDDIEGAEEFLLQALKSAYKLRIRSKIIQISGLLAEVYLDLDELEKAKDYAQRAIKMHKIIRSKDVYLLIGLYYSLAEAEYYLDNIDNALDALEDAIDLIESLENYEDITDSVISIYRLYAEVLLYSYEQENTPPFTGILEEEVDENFINSIGIKKNKEDLILAKEYNIKALKLLKQLPQINKNKKIDIYVDLIEITKSLGERKETLKYIEEILEIMISSKEYLLLSQKDIIEFFTDLVYIKEEIHYGVSSEEMMKIIEETLEKISSLFDKYYNEDEREELRLPVLTILLSTLPEAAEYSEYNYSDIQKKWLYKIYSKIKTLKDKDSVISTYINLGKFAYEIEEYETSEKILNEIISFLQKSNYALSIYSLVEAYKELGKAKVSSEQYEEGIKIIEKAIDLALNKNIEESSQVVILYSTLAQAYLFYAIKRASDAAGLPVIEAFEDKITPEYFNDAFREYFKYVEKYYSKAIELGKKVAKELENIHNLVINIWFDWIDTLIYINDYKKAEQELTKADNWLDEADQYLKSILKSRILIKQDIINDLLTQKD